MTRTHVVWGTSLSSVPRVTTILAAGRPRRPTRRRGGRTTATARWARRRAAPRDRRSSNVTAKQSFAGHVIDRATPSTSSIGGTAPTGSRGARRVRRPRCGAGSRWRMSQSAAPVAASPASFQPEKAATSSGSTEVRMAFPDQTVAHRASSRPAFSVPVCSSARCPCRTADEYRESLRDGRVLWYRGRGVDDVTDRPRSARSRSSTPRSTSRSATIPRTATSRSRRPRDRRGVQRLLPDPALDRRPARRMRLVELARAARRHAAARSRTSAPTRCSRSQTVLQGEELDRAHGVLPTLPRRRPRGRGRADRREGRPLEGAARAGRPRPARARRRPERRRASSCAAPRCTRRSRQRATRSSCCPRAR